MRITYTGSTKERLDRFIQTQRPDQSRSAVQKFIKSHEVLVNGKQATVHHWLKNGDVIEAPDRPSGHESAASPQTPNPGVFFRNEQFAVVIKPAGLLIHPTERGEKHTLASWTKASFPNLDHVGHPDRPGIVHRLDKDVGGLVLVALTPESYEFLQSLFRERAIVKKYYCLVHGVIENEGGTIETPIERNKTTGRMVAQSAKRSGKLAVTTFDVVRRFRDCTLLDVQIITGRTHQIRAHFFSIGHSVVGDQLYRTRDVRKKNQHDPLTKPFLYAYHIAFTDADGSEQRFEIPLPDDLEQILNNLKE